MFTLAHLTDPHLGPLPPIRLGELMNKRVLGYLSWTRRRHKIHRPEVLEALAGDLRALAPSHLAITGDITNISLPGEFENALTWFQTLGEPHAVSVIPGNHDAYVEMPWQQSLAHWRDYMTSDDGNGDVRHPEGHGHFPFVRRRGEVALIGLSSACPSPPTFATGRLGQGQLARLAGALEAAGREGLFRVVLVHHPPSPTAIKRRKCLTDGTELCAVIAELGAELILHGHDHSFAQEQIAGPQGEVPVFGLPSASAVSGTERHPVSHYQTYRITRNGAAWRISVSVRGFSRESRSFEPVRDYHREVGAG